MKRLLELKKITRLSSAETLKAYTKMYIRFLLELDEYGRKFEDYPVAPPQLSVTDIVEETNTCTHRYMLLVDDVPAGLLTIGVDENCHPDADHYIQDFYIAPEYRRKGIGVKMMNLFVKDHPGIYCMVVIKGNVPAEQFWTEYILYGSGITAVEDIHWQTRKYLNILAFKASARDYEDDEA